MKKNNQQYKFAFIASYKEMAEVAKTVRDQYQLNYSINVGNLPGCLDIVRRKIEMGTDVVITRGGNVLKIREQFDIPVVEIEVSAIDIIKALKKAERFETKIGVLGFPNIIYRASYLANVLGVKSIEIKINSIDESIDAVKKALSLGAGVIVGDRIAVETAKQLGVEGVLITTESHECILDAFSKAVHIAEVRKKELAKAEQMKIITEFTHSGIVAIDRDGIITLFNAQAVDVLGISHEKAIGKPVNEMLTEFNFRKTLDSQEKSLNELIQFEYQHVIVHKIPIIIGNDIMGVVATFHKLEHIQYAEKKARKALMEKGHIAMSTFDNIIGESKKIREAIIKACKYAFVDSVVLINGETGVGKEVFAQSIHNNSPRNNGPFIAVNCATLHYNLLESELFGYVKGAFTGARSDGKVGLFEQAHGGTIFLDEIGEIPLNLQSRLLRVLQEGQIQRIGDDKIISVDVRVISATNKDLFQLVQENKFREDLFYRINVLNLQLPSLMERVEDIPLLVKHFIKKISEKYKKSIIQVDNEVITKLCEYQWPGNIRQLENVVERLIVESVDGKIEPVNVDDVLYKGMKYNVKILNLDYTIKETIEKALKVSNNNKSKACKMLGIDRSTLWRKMKKLGLE